MVVVDPPSPRVFVAPDWPEQLAVRVSRCYVDALVTDQAIARAPLR